MADRPRGSDPVALIVTLHIDPVKWTAAFGSYDAEDVIDYVDGWLNVSPAATSGCIHPGMDVRFRRQPKPDRPEDT